MPAPPPQSSAMVAAPGDGTARTALAIHVDLDGATHIYRAHGRVFRGPLDSVFVSGMETMLAVFEERGIRATLFVIAEDVHDPAKRYLIGTAVERGHDLASHTLTHPNLLRLTRAQKELELVRSKAVIEDAFGVPVTGFRAPGYAIDAESLALLGKAGYKYDSSAFPTALFARRLGCSVDDLRRPRRFGVSESDPAGVVELPLPGPAPNAMPLGPSFSLAFRVPAARWTLARAARRGAPTALLFHLIDFAAPIESPYREGARLTLFTLSTRSAGAKRAACSRLLDFVRTRFAVTSTSELLARALQPQRREQ
ncbi:MAG: polysaccharide deacetylase family protein [Gemmatimonadaceae bacterium]